MYINEKRQHVTFGNDLSDALVNGWVMFCAVDSVPTRDIKSRLPSSSSLTLPQQVKMWESGLSAEPLDWGRSEVTFSFVFLVVCDWNRQLLSKRNFLRDFLALWLEKAGISSILKEICLYIQDWFRIYKAKRNRQLVVLQVPRFLVNCLSLYLSLFLSESSVYFTCNIQGFGLFFYM